MRSSTRENQARERIRKKIAAKRGKKKICITGIMKNEGKNVERLLDSLLSMPPDMVSIVDTGSTDDTKEKIVGWGKLHNIPTAVHEEPFVNFAYNRTHSIKMARKAFPEADYFLLTDADFIWEIPPGERFDKVLLIDHKYLIEQYNPSLRYWNVRMLSSSVEWECVGVTHEYWRESPRQTIPLPQIRTSKIRTLVINDKEDGGCKEDKFSRDEKLLKDALADPGCPADLRPRYRFYLAQTLKDVGRCRDSIECYKERIRDKGWAEEIYYSKFQIGVCYERLAWKKQKATEDATDNATEDATDNATEDATDNATEDATDNATEDLFALAQEYYEAAYEYRKLRAESIYELTRMLRLLGRNSEALYFARIGKKIPYPSEDSLFIGAACYSYLFDYEISIVAFYVEGYKGEGRNAISNLLSRDDIPEHIRACAEKNSRYYL